MNRLDRQGCPIELCMRGSTRGQVVVYIRQKGPQLLHEKAAYV